MPFKKSSQLAEIWQLLTSTGLKGTIARAGVGSVTVKLARTGLGFLIAVLLARILGPEGYGIYTYVLTLVSFLAIPAQFGLPNLVVRETAYAQTKEKWGYLRGLWRWASLTAVTFSVVVTTLGFLASWIYADSFSKTQLTTFQWGLVLIPLIALGKLRGAALRGLRLGVLGQIPETVLRPALFAAFIGSMMLWNPSDGLNPETAIIFNIVALTLSFIAGALMLRTYKPTELRFSPAPEYSMKVWSRAVMPFAMVSGAHLILKTTDILLLGVFGSAEEVGFYRVAIQGSLLVVFGLQAIEMIVAPYFSRLYNQGNKATLQRLVHGASKASLTLSLPLIILFVFAGEEILSLVFGEDFQTAAAPLIILGLGQLINATFGPIGALLNMTGNEKESVKAVSWSSALNVVLNLCLIPIAGMSGAATATTLSLTFRNILLRRAASTRLELECLPYRQPVKNLPR